MDASIVFHKTAAGQRELQSPELGLDTTARQLLILIDGKRSVADLMLLLTGHAEVGKVLLTLLGAGLITTSSAAAVPPEQRRTADPSLPAQAGFQQQQPPAAPAPIRTQAPQAQPPQAQPGPYSPPAPGAAQPAAYAPTNAPPPGAETWPGVMPPTPAVAAPPSTAPAAPAAPAEDAGNKVEEAKGAIMREIREIFGKDADPVVLKVRNCRNLAELGILVSRVREIAVDYAGRQVADEFLHTSKRILELAQ